MSIPVKQSITCPNCGKPIEFTMWQSINTEMDFALPDIISGKLFEVECSCGFQGGIDYPIMFNDMQHKALIHYARPEDVEDARKACQPFLRYGYKVRIVPTLNSLREKTKIFNDGLDDRVIEIMKLLNVMKLDDRIDRKAIDEILYLKKEPGIYFEMHCSGRADVFAIRPDLYTQTERAFSKYFDGEDDIFVDVRWAANILRKAR